MEGGRILKKNHVNIAHLPTLIVAIGYPLFWAQMFSGQARDGVTSPLAWGLFIFFAVWIAVREKEAIVQFLDRYRKEFQVLDAWSRVFLAAGLAVAVLILSRLLLASLLPPHLSQESDTMNYHLSMPRQHLILGSFTHIPWSADDLFFLPLDFALAPFWFATELPNKIPQFIFLLGLIGVSFSLARQLNGSLFASSLVVLALLGSHGHAVQMGTAMLDLVICYLFLAMIDSFLKKQKWLFIIECAFFMWAKSLVFLQVAAIALLLGALYWIAKRAGFKVLLDFQRSITVEDKTAYRHFLKQIALPFVLVSVCVAGPFMAKSLHYAGTPFFPVAVGAFPHPGLPEGTAGWTSLSASAQYLTQSIANDGYGRSVIDFVTHLWMIAVPEAGVNNAFDYPLGLTYLIFLGPFVFFLVTAVRKKEFPVLPCLVVVYWLLWWMSVRETRHLYIPVLLMFLTVAVQIKKPSKILMTIILTAMLLNAVSVFRAHIPHWGPGEEVLGPNDRVLVEMSRQYLKDQRSDMVELEWFEVAFAQFPAVVRKEILPHVIAF
jgi:hypothetical protein